MTEKEHEDFWRETTANALVQTGNMSISELIEFLSVDRDGYQEIEI